MKPQLVYFDDDQEIEKDLQLACSGRTVSLLAGTIAGSADKPNEDAFSVSADEDTFLIGVFDGVTSLQPISALDGVTGARFASHFLKDTLALIDSTMSVREIVTDLNSRLREKDFTYELMRFLDVSLLPASTGTLIKITREQITFAHVGDSFGIAYFINGHSEVFTDNRNEPFDKKIFHMIDTIAQESNITHRQAKEDDRVTRSLREMYLDRNNNPQGTGCGVLNGDPAVEKYIQAGSLSTDGLSAIFLGTDGVVPLGWALKSERDRQKLRTTIQESGFKKLFKIKKESEDNDPDWQHIRYKHSDDATGILLLTG